MAATSWGPPSWPPSTLFYLDDLGAAADHAQTAAQRLALDKQYDMRLDGLFPQARDGEHGAQRSALDHIRDRVRLQFTEAWWGLVTDVVPGSAGAYARAAEMVLRAVMTGAPVPSAAELEATLAAVPFTPPPLPDLEDFLPQPSTTNEQLLRQAHTELAESYRGARIPGDQMWRLGATTYTYPPGREHLPPPEVDEQGGSLRWEGFEQLPRIVTTWGVAMHRAALHKAGIDDAIAANGGRGFWLDE